MMMSKIRPMVVPLCWKRVVESTTGEDHSSDEDHDVTIGDRAIRCKSRSAISILSMVKHERLAPALIYAEKQLQSSRNCFGWPRNVRFRG
jgi:hypothetical protein